MCKRDNEKCNWMSTMSPSNWPCFIPHSHSPHMCDITKSHGTFRLQRLHLISLFAAQLLINNLLFAFFSFFLIYDTRSEPKDFNARSCEKTHSECRGISTHFHFFFLSLSLARSFSIFTLARQVLEVELLLLLWERKSFEFYLHCMRQRVRV